MRQQESIGKWLSALYRYSQMYISKNLEQYNIGSGQYLILLVLIKKEGMNQESLSKSLHLDKATITRSINKLMKEGYVTRKKDPNDKRAYLLYITKKGKKIVPRIKKVLSHTSKILLSGFTRQEKKSALQLMKKMYQNITTIETI